VLTLISDLPDAVVGVRAHEKVTAEDYEKVLVPAVEAAEAASGDGKIRMLYVLGEEFPDFSAGAAWADTKLGLGRIRDWERIAVVSDADWLRRTVHALSWMMPGEVKVFAAHDLDEAREWVTAEAAGPR
jgi:hypothetical protein